MTLMTRLSLCVVTLLLVACGGASSDFTPGADPGVQGGVPVLESAFVIHDSLNQDSKRFSQGEEIEFILSVKNNSSQEGVLAFNSGQQFDFYVEDANNFEVWRWSANQLFTQALTEIKIPAGETVTFKQKWNQRLNNGTLIPTGDYKMYGFVIGQPELFIDVVIQ